ncbi:MAG: S8 family serine peptidase [Polyangiaceae bacterium]
MPGTLILQLVEGLEEARSDAALDALLGIAVSQLAPQATLEPHFAHEELGAIAALTKRAQETQTFVPYDFTAFTELSVSGGTDLEALAKVLRTSPAVRNAYVMAVGPDPSVSGEDSGIAWQHYLEPAPTGVDALFAWNHGGDGGGQVLADVERGWTLEHQDLVDHGVGGPSYGAIDPASRGHGTSVLGVACAWDHGPAYPGPAPARAGCTGIAPNPRLIQVFAINAAGTDLTSAVVHALDGRAAGDVVLLEVQALVPSTGGPSALLLPVEVYPHLFALIHTAVTAGVVVVAAGGNGTLGADGHGGHTPALNMDDYVSDFGGGPHLPFDRSARDSGAILVSAATSTTPHQRLAYAPHGARIDAYAWGEDVFAPDSPGGSTIEYRGNFNGTSAAAAIIAGTALALQSAHELRVGTPLPGLVLRDVLTRDGTLPAPGALGIGVMPNLRAVLENHIFTIAAGHDVYVRDFVGDVGDPHSGAISASPDVILRNALAPDPTAVFGAASGTEASMTLGQAARTGQANYIYVRVKNRGIADVHDVRAMVYWAPVATLITPNLWTLVGSTLLPLVPAGDVLTVAPPITWAAADLPASGHYCFVCVLDHPGDPAPDFTGVTDWASFRAMIRGQNNVTWRNFNVVAPTASGSPFTLLPFMAPGAPKEARAMSITIGGTRPLPPGILLELPRDYAAKLEEAGHRLPEVDEVPAALADARGRLLRVDPDGTALPRLVFKAGSAWNLRLHARHGAEPYEIHVRQLEGNEEVGRVTWRLLPADTEVV